MRDEQLEQRTQWLEANYPYVRFYVCPFVFVVSALFPHVETTEEALVFLYACRLFPAVLLIVILLAADRAFDLPFMALFFFSLPLVMQQAVIVSADTFLNLGAL